MKLQIDKGITKIQGKVIYVETKKVTSFGNGAKIDFYKDFIGKNVLVAVIKND